MRDIHCPKDIGFENTFSGEDCEKEQYYDNCYHCWSTAKEKAIQELWIPVTKRLPEENKTVMVSTKYGGVYPEARYTEECGWEWAYESGADYWEEIEDDVEAWMPLPKRYKPQQERDKEYGVEVVTRGNCMMCGKELSEDEGLFFCKECSDLDLEHMDKKSFSNFIEQLNKLYTKKHKSEVEE